MFSTNVELINYILGLVGLKLHRVRIPEASLLEPSPVRKLPQHRFVHCRVLPSRTDLIKAMPRGGVVAEIGVADGDFSAEILRFNKPAALYLVDTWESARYQRGFEHIQTRFGQEIKGGSVILNRGRSIDILPTLPEKSFDWLYLDTTHEYADTIKELFLCASIVKDGGHIVANTAPGCWGPMITPAIRGGHEVTRPIAVAGAEVGDAIAIRIREIKVTSIATASGTAIRV